MAKPATPLTTADLIVLSLLAERAMHGYELLGEYERQEVADWASVSKAQVYYAIEKLARLRCIAPVKDKDDTRERTTYSPTPAGRKRLAQSLANTDWAQTRVAQPFTTWLGLSIHLTISQMAPVLLARKTYLLETLEKERQSLKYIRTLKSDRAKAGALIVTLVIAQIETELQWLDQGRNWAT